MRIPRITICLCLFAVLFCAHPSQSRIENARPALETVQRRSTLISVVDGCLLGGSEDGKWIDPVALTPSVKGGEKYQVYNLNGPGQILTGGKVGVEHFCDYRYLELTPEITERGEVEEGVGIISEWNAMPRVPQVLPVTNPEYQAIARSLLQQKGIRRPEVKLMQVMRVDLEGDGVDEVLMSASRGRRVSMYDGPAEAGDYSFVLLRKIIGGRARNLILFGEFYPRSKRDITTHGWVSGVLDANGDGVMEIAYSTAEYHGSGTIVVSVGGGKVTETPLECSCGG